MASSSFSSDSDITDKVDALIAEATDLCALETIAALNSAHFPDSRALPSTLETRFAKLKSFDSFPATTMGKKDNTPESRSCFDPQQLGTEELDPSEDLEARKQQRVNSGCKDEDALEQRRRRGGSSRSPSPGQQSQICGCFNFTSPKLRRVLRMKGRSSYDSDDDDDILTSSGFGSGSMKENRRRLKKAWSEHEKASREAEKMVRWVSQVSTRINEAAIDELMKEELK